MGPLRIGWMIRAGGIFGSVREVIEVGNALMRRGHQFTVYTDEGKDLGWLPNTLRWAHTSSAAREEMDVLFWSDTPDEPYYATFKGSNATLKAYVMMGFDPSTVQNDFGTPAYRDLFTNYWVLADGPWQLKFIREAWPWDNDVDLGPAVGGVNLRQFRPVIQPYTADVVWSGDPRPRKGGDTVAMAVEGLKVDSYFKKRVAQEDMSAYICRAPIFVDGHKRGGWCNPVLEAMACGRAIVCTATSCNSDFVEHGINALMVEPGDFLGMRQWIDILLKDPPYVEMLATEAYKTSRRFGYDTVVEKLEREIFERLK